MSKILLCILQVTIAFFLISPADYAARAASAIPSGTYKYLETSGEQTSQFYWHISYPEELVEIKVDSTEYKTVNRCRKDGETVFWSARKGDGQTVSAVRNGHELAVTRVENGKQSVKTYKIDERPWFQPISYSLHDFLASDRESITFWSIRMDTGKPVVLKAQKTGTDSLTLENDPVPAVKIDVRLDGPLSMFWRGSYWYRLQDGLFLKHQSKLGPAQSMSTSYHLVGKVDG